MDEIEVMIEADDEENWKTYEAINTESIENVEDQAEEIHNEIFKEII